ncbi:MAG TPA: ABC transporter substrate-binding protein [Stellaceae bacterium]|nr:ABC transporter substrate-binding protein [Stellaceae bacterium]
MTGFRTGKFGLPLAAFLLAVMALGAGAARAQSYDNINIATNAEPDTLDMLTSVFPPISYVVLRNVDEMLWGYKLDGSVRPTVADWMVSPDGTTITFHIRPGIKFHSGDELVADDVLFSFKRMMSNTPSFKRHGRLVKSVDKLDTYTVRFTWDKPDVTFFDGMQIFLGSKAYFDRVGEKEFMTHPSGIGPYKLVKYSPGQYIDLVRFDGYYGDKPKVKAARFSIVKDDETRLAKLKAGEADIVMNAPYPNVGELEKDGFHLVKFPANPSVSIVFDLLTPQSPWHKRAVREAIAHAIDPHAIINGLFHGVPYRYPMLAPGEAGYDPGLKNYDYNPALAKKLLAEAGYPNGFKMPLYYAGTAFYGFRQAAEVVALYLKAIGIECELHNQEAVQGLQMARRAQADHSIELVTVGALPIANTGLTSLDMLTIAFHSTAPSVVSHFDAVDAGIEKALGELDPAKRAETIRGVVDYLYNEVAVVKLWDSVSVYAMKKGVDYTPIAHRMPFMLLANVTVGSP